MHHLLPMYGKHQDRVLKTYYSLCKLTKWPLVGGLVRKIANSYAKKQHGAFILKTQEVFEVIDLSRHVYLGPCACRRIYKNCDIEEFSELVLDNGEFIYSKSPELKEFKLITKEEAKDAVLRLKEKGVVHALIACHGMYYSLCNCCSCCCVPLRMKKEYGIEFAFTRDESVVERFKEQMQNPQDHHHKH